MAGVVQRRNVLIAAAVLGLVASLLTYKFLQNTQEKGQTKVSVIVASQDIKAREIISSAMLRSEEVAANEFPSGAISNPEDVINQVAVVDIPAQSPIRPIDISPRDIRLGLSYSTKMRPNMRAVTVAVDPVISVAGFLRPGDKVDVIATFRKNDQAVAKTILQDVQLLALGPQLEEERVKEDGQKPAVSSKDTATLLVTPFDAERLVLAENEGKLRLTLRTVGDIARVQSIGAKSSSLTGIADRTASSQPKVTVSPSSYRERPGPDSRPMTFNPFGKNGSGNLPPSTSIIVKEQPKGHQIEVIRGTDIEKVEVPLTASAQ